MSIRNLAEPIFDPIDLAELLGPSGIRELIEIMWSAYHQLRKEMLIKKDDFSQLSENRITELWVMRLRQIWYKENRATEIKIVNLYPDTQHEDITLAKKRGQAPTIDFCFRTWNETVENSRYFGGECKNLKESDNSLLKRYVKTGVENYVSGRYGSSSSCSAIIGYVLEGDINDIINKIKTILNRQLVQKISIIRDFSYTDPHYSSNHTRTLDSKEIKIDHLMFDFT